MPPKIKFNNEQIKEILEIGNRIAKDKSLKFYKDFSRLFFEETGLTESYNSLYYTYKKHRNNNFETPQHKSPISHPSTQSTKNAHPTKKVINLILIQTKYLFFCDRLNI
jgi:hypothetical protein